MLPNEKKTQLVTYWRSGSSDDLASAREISAHTQRYTAALFFAHLAVEKALKASLVEHFGVHAPFTHNLLHLVSRLGWNVESEMADLLTEINDFNLEGRYPDEKDSFRKKATRAYTAAKMAEVEKVLQWISSKSNPGS